MKAKREKSAMYRTLSNRKDFSRIKIVTQLEKMKFVNVGGKVLVARMWLTQIKDKCKLYASITTVAVMFGK